MTWTREDYHRMGEAGIIAPTARVELIEGEVLTMSPIGPGHSSTVMLLDRYFHELLGDRALCRVQSPIVLGDDSEPEPDIAIVRPQPDFYRDRHPASGDVILVIEVSESSLTFDLVDKAALYARHGIPEYWVVDLNRNIVIVHRALSGLAYSSVTECDRSQQIAPAAFADASLDLREIMPGDRE